jgi:hypothetical protein
METEGQSASDEAKRKKAMTTVETMTTELQAGIETPRASGNHPKADTLLLLATILGTLIPGFMFDVGALVAWAASCWGSVVGAHPWARRAGARC